MEATLHRVSQYIAAAGRSYLIQEADDGHTTLTWDPERQAMVGKPIPKAKDISFALVLPHYAMECSASDGSSIDLFPLQSATHKEMVSWFRRMLSAQGADGGAYEFRFHYELDCHADTDPLPAPDKGELTRLADLRTKAHHVLETVVALYKDTDPVRIWPHHFDSGSLITLEREANGNPRATIGIGLAIPDTIVPEHYFYCSPWRKDGAESVNGMPALSKGRWITEGYNGAIVGSEGSDQVELSAFFREATRALQQQIIA